MNNPLDSETAEEFGTSLQDSTSNLLPQIVTEGREEQNHRQEVGTLHEQPRVQESKVAIANRRRSFEPYLSDKTDGETFTKIFIYTICSATVLTVSILISKSFLFNGGSVDQSSYPTSIPWIKSKLDCENSGRNWIDSKCWDKEHSSAF